METGQNNESEYVPFGDEWKKEMMKWDKKSLIEFLGEKLKALKELEAAADQGRKFKDVN